MGIMDKIRSWWSKDDAEVGKEEAPVGRDVQEDSVEAVKEDEAANIGGEFGTMPGVDTDFERDSERPR